MDENAVTATLRGEEKKNSRGKEKNNPPKGEGGKWHTPRFYTLQQRKRRTVYRRVPKNRGQISKTKGGGGVADIGFVRKKRSRGGQPYGSDGFFGVGGS